MEGALGPRRPSVVDVQKVFGSKDAVIPQTIDAAFSALARPGGAKEVRRGAVQLLVKELPGLRRDKTRAAQIAPELVVSLSDRKLPIKRAAIRLLEWCGKQAEPQLGEIVRALSDNDVTTRCWAARCIAAIGPASAVKIDTIVKALRDGDAAVRCLTAGALARMGHKGDAIVSLHAAGVADALYDDDVEVRRAAAFALVQMGETAAPHAAKISGALSDRDVDVRRLAASCLERCGEQIVAYSGELIKALYDDDVQVRRWTARSLEHMARSVSKHVQEIGDCLERDPDACVRIWLMLTLARIGRDAENCVQQVTSCLNDPDPAVRCLAVGTLTQFGERQTAGWLAARHGKHVVDALAEGDAEGKRAAALSLALMGDSAAEQIDEILDSLRDDDVTVRRAAAQALEQIHNLERREAQDAAELLTEETDVAVKLWLIRALAQMGEIASDFVSNVDAVLNEKDPHPALVQASVLALRQMGEQGSRLADAWRQKKERERARIPDSYLHKCYACVCGSAVSFIINRLCCCVDTKVAPRPRTLRYSRTFRPSIF